MARQRALSGPVDNETLERKKARYAAPGSYTFPKPRHQWFKTHMAGQFFLYINRLTRMTPLQLEKLQVRVYQDWPVRIPKPANPDGSKTTSELELFEGVPMPGNPCLFGASTDSNYEIEFLQRYGSGKFRILINELGVLNAICSLSLEIHDPDYPPKIAPEDVDLLVSANQNYIRQMRDRGVVFPGETNQADEEEEEVNAELVNRAVDQAAEVGRLSATVENMKEKIAVQPAPPPAVPAVDPSVMKSSVDFVQDMARVQVEAVKETFGKGFDIDRAVDAVVKLGTLGKKEDSAASAVLTMLDRRNELLEKELAAMRQDTLARTQDELKFLRERVSQPTATTPPERRKSLREELEEAKQLLEEFGGNGKNDAKEDRIERWLGYGLKLLPTIGTIATTIADRIGHYSSQAAYYNAIGRANPGGAPAPAGMGVVARPQAPAYQNTQPVVQVVQPPSPPPQPPAPPPDPNVTAALQAGVPPQLIDYLQRWTKPLVKIWMQRPEMTGADFAVWVMEDGTGSADDEGQMNYLTIRSQIGKANLLAILKAWAPIWTVIGQAPSEEVEQFIDEFMAADQQQEEAEENGPREVVRTNA
jgi:hypothetical protein